MNDDGQLAMRFKIKKRNLTDGRKLAPHVTLRIVNRIPALTLI